MKNLIKYAAENLSTGIAIVATATAGVLGFECYSLSQRLEQKRADIHYLYQKDYDRIVNMRKIEVDGVRVDVSLEQATKVEAVRKSRDDWNKASQELSQRMDNQYHSESMDREILERKLASLPNKLIIQTNGGPMCIDKYRANDDDIEEYRFQKANPFKDGENYDQWDKRVREELEQARNKK